MHKNSYVNTLYVKAKDTKVNNFFCYLDGKVLIVWSASALTVILLRLC